MNRSFDFRARRDEQKNIGVRLDPIMNTTPPDCRCML